jgi:SAM-dependent methyltransferase
MPGKIEKQREHFESMSDDYFRATQHPNCLEFNRLIWKYFLTRHAYILPRDAKVLEPMCGHGIAKEYLENAIHGNFHYTGFDYSQPLVEIARRRMPDAHIFLQDVTTFQPTERYDLIFLSGGLHHVFDHTPGVLERLRHSLAPGGYMLSAEPTYDNAAYGMIGKAIYKHSTKFEDESEQRYELEELNAHYCAAGFTIIDQMYPGLAAYIIAVSAFCFPRFCIGSPALIRTLVRLENPLYRRWLGRKLSFCTFTLLKNAA